MRITHRRAVLAAALGAALALTACAGDDELAATETELSEDDRLARLEAELQELRSDTDDAGSTVADTDTAADGDRDEGDGAGDEGDIQDDAEADSDDAATDGDGEHRAVEVGETFNSWGGALTVTVERVRIQENWVEVEVTAYNDHPQVDFSLWNGTNLHMPMLFDEQDRRFGYQHPAGYSPSQEVKALPGQRLDAVMVFGGSLHPDAQALTLRFHSRALDEWEITVPVTEVQP